MKPFPEGMLRRGRGIDPEFEVEEPLFRRFRPEAFDENAIAIDAIPLPDMSVNRGKYGPPEWLLIDHENFGVAGFKVKDIPKSVRKYGTYEYTFAPEHVPLDRNYPHSEVRVYSEGQRVRKTSELDPEAHLVWREKLARRLFIAIRPHDEQ